jgi:hypothetical protein
MEPGWSGDPLHPLGFSGSGRDRASALTPPVQAVCVGVRPIGGPARTVMEGLRLLRGSSCWSCHFRRELGRGS